MIGIIDYQAGNTRSVQNALERLGVAYILTDDTAKLDRCEKIIFPGVGAAGSAMQRLHEQGLVEWIRQCEKPFLGICLGMQLLFEFSAEDNVDCLRVIPGRIQKFKPGKKIPHMGWNNCERGYYYFVHSYFAPISQFTTLSCQYQNETFSAAVQKDNFYGYQFHPEKSGDAGEKLIAEFVGQKKSPAVSLSLNDEKPLLQGREEAHSESYQNIRRTSTDKANTETRNFSAFRPCIDIHQGKVKQIVGSSLGSQVETNFSTAQSGVEFAKAFAEHGFTGGHICVLDKSDASKNLALEVLNAFPGSWQIGGGMNARNAAEYLAAGADKIIITSSLFSDDDVFTTAAQLAEAIGADNLVFDLSAKESNGEYYLMKDQWRTQTDFAITPVNLTRLKPYCAEFLVHGVAVEGKKSGFDEPLISRLAQWASEQQFPITYAGGITTLTDIESFQQRSQNRLDFTIGSALALFGGRITLAELKPYAHAH